MLHANPSTRVQPALKTLPSITAPTPRDYQVDALAAIRAARDRGVRRQLVCLASALGKTVVFAGLPKALSLIHGDVVVIVAHRDELILQAAQKMRAANPGVAINIEKAAARADRQSEAVAASIQTLVGTRLEEFLARFRGRIALLVIDEAHRAAAPTYTALINRMLDERQDAIVVGFTATPNRSDNLALGSVFQEIVIERSTQWGIENGYLVGPKCFRVESKTSLDDIPIVHGDFERGQLGRRVNNAERNSLIVSAYKQHTPNQKAIVFCASVAHAEQLTQTFRLAGIPVATANGTTSKSDRSAILQLFRAGAVRVLVNVSLFTEGFDVPDTEVVVIARPTQSAIVFQQAIGRILRPVDEVTPALALGSTPESRRAAIGASRKPYGVVLDVVDHTRRHRLISLPSLWGLPIRFNLEGHPVSEAQEEYRKLHALAPRAAEHVTTYDEILTKLREVPLFAVQPLDPTVKRHATLLWRPFPQGAFRLSLPVRMEALDRTGQPVPQLRRRFLEEIERARARGAANPRTIAQEMLNIDPATLTDVHEHMEIRPNLLGTYDVVSILNGKEAEIPSAAATLPAAFAAAEQWLRENRTHEIAALSLQAPWRSRPISPAQKKLLQVRYNVPDDLLPRSQGEASELITQLGDKIAATITTVRQSQG
jgi:superfamily II DNA or RNA helicase